MLVLVLVVSPIAPSAGVSYHSVYSCSLIND